MDGRIYFCLHSLDKIGIGGAPLIANILILQEKVNIPLASNSEESGLNIV